MLAFNIRMRVSYTLYKITIPTRIDLHCTSTTCHVNFYTQEYASGHVYFMLAGKLKKNELNLATLNTMKVVLHDIG